MNSLISFLRHHKSYLSFLILPPVLLASFSAGRKQPSTVYQAKETKKVRIGIQSQPYSPLAITSASVESADPLTPNIKVTLANATDSMIRAFAIRCDTRFGESTMSSWSVNNILSIENGFRSRSTQTLTINDTNYSRPPESATLSVDFVEFLDGSRWGDDTYRSAERLDGWRAGAHAEVKSIVDKIQTTGLNSAIVAIESKGSDTNLPSGFSTEYLDGFRLGTDAIRARVLHTRGKNSLERILEDLRRPIDLSDRR